MGSRWLMRHLRVLLIFQMKTSNHFCHNHPLVAAIDSCVTCDKHLCGLCANFADSAVYCEACFKNYEAESLVKSKRQRMNEQNSKSFKGIKKRLFLPLLLKAKLISGLSV